MRGSTALIHIYAILLGFGGSVGATEEECERLQNFSHPARQQEFVATRLLRHAVFGFSHIHYDAHGAPYIQEEGFISISHCRNTVALAVNPTYKIGLDLERERLNILQLSSKFLSEAEKIIFDAQDPRIMMIVLRSRFFIIFVFINK